VPAPETNPYIARYVFDAGLIALAIGLAIGFILGYGLRAERLSPIGVAKTTIIPLLSLVY
jgi:hypothetical protein